MDGLGLTFAYLTITTIISLFLYILVIALCVATKKSYKVYLVYLGIQFGFTVAALISGFYLFFIVQTMPIVIVLTALVNWTDAKRETENAKRIEEYFAKRNEANIAQQISATPTIGEAKYQKENGYN